MSAEKEYKLLPFKFTHLMDQELLVSEPGDYLFVPLGTVKTILEGSVAPTLPLYRDLLSKNIICKDYNSYIQDFLSTRIRTKKSFLDHFTTLHIFVLTLRCNQKCIYCQASSHDKSFAGKDMSIIDLDKAIDLMLMSPNHNITMEFQGGESSLAPSLIKYAVTETEKRNRNLCKDIKFVLCTNIIQIEPSLLQFCLDHRIFISTSLDGPQFIHDHNRGVDGSFNKFKASLNTIRNIVGHERISALMTTSDLSLDYPTEIINTYRDLGFNNIFLRPLNPYGRASFHSNWRDYYDRFIEFYKNALDYIININVRGERFVEGFTATIMKKILTPYPIGFVDLQSPAGIINSVVVYNYDGGVYCSDESRMMAEKGDFSFKLGTVYDDYKDLFYGQKAQKISKIWATEYIAGCSDCAYQQYCGADPVRNYSTQGDMYGHRPTSLFCYFHKSVFDYLFEMIYKRGEIVLPIFRSWIYD